MASSRPGASPSISLPPLPGNRPRVSSGKGIFPAGGRGPRGRGNLLRVGLSRDSLALRRPARASLVVMTNDAWFGERSATWQHYHMAAFRAVESGAAVARASTSGITALIDPYGRAITETRLFERTLRVGDLPTGAGTDALPVGRRRRRLVQRLGHPAPPGYPMAPVAPEHGRSQKGRQTPAAGSLNPGAHPENKRAALPGGGAERLSW